MSRLTDFRLKRKPLKAWQAGLLLALFGLLLYSTTHLPLKSHRTLLVYLEAAGLGCLLLFFTIKEFASRPERTLKPIQRWLIVLVSLFGVYNWAEMSLTAHGWRQHAATVWLITTLAYCFIVFNDRRSSAKS